MATYTVTFVIDDTPPNGYPLLMEQANGTFGNYNSGSVIGQISDTTLYFKQGDTIRVKHIHPSGAAITYAGSDTAPAGSAHPDPTPEGSQVSGYEWREITWSGNFTDDSNNVTDSADDYETFWYFWQGTSHSQKLRFSKVSGTITASSSTVAQGGTITFSVSDLTGLETATGTTWPNQANRCWINIRDSNNSVMTGLIDSSNTPSLSYWSEGQWYLGLVKMGSTSTTLTIPAAFPTGTYTANLNHYNAGIITGTNADNKFHGTDHKMSSVTFTVVGAGTSNPNNFSFTNVTVPPSTATISSEAQLAGMTAASTVTALSTGTEYRLGGNSGGGSWIGTTGGTVGINDIIQIRRTSSPSFNTPLTSYVKVGDTQSSGWVLTTEVANDSPDAFAFTDPTFELALDTEYQSDEVSLVGINTPSTITYLSSGASYKINREANWQTATGNSTNVPITGPDGSGNPIIRIKNTSHVDYSTSVAASIKVGSNPGTMSSDWTLTTPSAPDNPNPNPFSFNNLTGQTYNAAITSDPVDLLGMTAASTVTALTGTGMKYSIGSGAFTDATGNSAAVPAGSSIRLQFPAANAYSNTRTGTIKIGTTTSGIWSVTTEGDPTTIEYGVQLFNSSNQSIFDTRTDRTTVSIASGTLTMTIPSSAPWAITSPNAIDCIGMTTLNEDEIDVFYSGPLPPGRAQIYGSGVVQTLRGSGDFEIKLTGYAGIAGNTYTINYTAVRY